ncbi:MAG: ATP-binding protein [Solirubrobacterales bacterium]
MSDAEQRLAATLGPQPAALAALVGALRSGPVAAYLLEGPAGTGKAAAARAFAAELLAAEAPDPDDTRRRALVVPSPHPDLVWLEPPGTQHLVETVREQIIRQAAFRPFEGARRVFVVDEAHALREESQNALLKTLEEPPAFAHFLLVSSEPEALLETVVSRCAHARFAPLSVAAIDEQLADLGVDGAERQAAARLAGGDLRRARFLLTAEGRGLRASIEQIGTALSTGNAASAPWGQIVSEAAAVGRQAADEAQQRLQVELGDLPSRSRESRRLEREAQELAKRAERRRRTDTLGLALALLARWVRDLGVCAAGAEIHAFNVDRLEALGAAAAGLDPGAARDGALMVAETRRRLDLNVNEELALEALMFRLEPVLSARTRVPAP